MSNSNFKPTTQQLSRVFLIEGRARPDHEPSLVDCGYMGSVDWPQGDITPIWCPSPDQFRQLVEVGQTFGAPDRPSSTITGRYPLDILSAFLRLAKRRCPFDVHINLGDCTDPSNPNEFKKKQIWEDVFGANYGTTDLGAFEDDNPVDENIDISAKDMAEIIRLTFAERGQNVVTNPLNDVVICSKPSCGDCDDEDDGCEIIYAVGDSSPGSPGTAPDVIWSVDSGVTLAADEITTLTNAENAGALACLGLYVVVVSNDDGGIHYKLKSDINAGTAALWTRTAVGIVVGGEPNDIWSVGTRAFVVGDGGYFYRTDNPVSGLTVIDAGVATTENLNAVHAISRLFAVGVGENGAVVFTDDGTSVQAVTAPAAISLSGIWIKDKDTWYVTANTGAVYYTIDGGNSWTLITNLPVTLIDANDIAFSNDSVGYIGGNIAGPAGVILRTYDGGQSWVSLPETTGNLPASDEYRALAACKYDENFVVAVGLADDALDGIYVVGE